MNQRRIDSLTPEQKAQFKPWAQKWIEIGLNTAPADRPRFESAVARCYQAAGLEPPKRIVWVRNPVEAVVTGPAAAFRLGLMKRGAVAGAVRGVVGGVVDGAVGGAVGDVVGGAVRGAVRGAVDGVVDGVVRDVVGDAVAGAVRDAVDDAVDGAVGDAVRGAVAGAVGGAVDGAVDGAVRGAVDDAVDDAVRDAPKSNALVQGALSAITRAYGYYMGGQFWAGGWWWGGAYTSFFREVCGLSLEGDLWDRGRAYEATIESACWWWPHEEFVIVSERPHTIRLERVAPDGWGSHRLHCEDGPAIAWEGLALYFWHGVHIPGDLIEHGWSTARILKEENAEVRRCAIECMGWDRFIVEAGLKQVGATVADPGNPGQELALYDVPEQIYDVPIRVLLCTNGSPERDGTRRRFGLTTPATINDPLTAAAWTFGLDREEYASLEVRR